MIGRRILNQGYGKLLLKTLSTRSDWSIGNLTPNKPTKWTFLNSNNSVLATGILTENINNSIIADLSLNSGEAKLYIDVDNLGNNLKWIYIWFYNHEITHLDISILPELVNFFIIYADNLNIITRDITKIKKIYIYSSTFQNANFINNSPELYYLKLYGNTSFNNNIIVLSDKQSLEVLSIESLQYLNIDTFDFRLYNLLKTVYLNKIDNNGDEKIYYFNQNVVQSLNLCNGCKIPQFETETFSQLTYLRLHDTQNTDVIDLSNLLTRLPSIDNLTFEKNVNVNEDITIESDTLKTINFRYGFGYKSLNIINTPNLNILNLYYSNLLEALSIDDISGQNITFVNIRYTKNNGEYDFNNLPNLTSIYWNSSYFTRMNIKNGNNANLSIDNHENYNDAKFIVDDETLPVFENATFRPDDILTTDET